MSALFDVPEPPRRKTAPANPDRPVWTKYAPKKPAKCGDCLLRLMREGGRGPRAMNARWQRRVGDQRFLLCFPHAQDWRDHDHLPRFEED